MRSTLASILLSVTLLGGCGGSSNYVKVDDVALGRVVVYRNGVAYYERRAHVAGDRLSVAVPADKVDDFLKSLTVLDAATGKPLAVSFPRQDSVREGIVDMVIQLPGKGPTDVVLTYITEAPAWKPSYRVQVRPDGKVMLQGWAVVDNTSGEDWKNIYVGVGSSSALSFRYDLWSVRQVHRETLANEERFAVAPPMGGATYADHGAQAASVYTLADADIPKPADHPASDGDYYRGGLDEAEDYGGYAGEATTTATGGGGGGGRGAKGTTRVTKADKAAKPAATAPPQPTPPPAYNKRLEEQRRREQQAQVSDQKVKSIAIQLKNNRNSIVIEGYADPNESNADMRALDRANTLRNKLIDEGVPPAQIKVEGKGVVAGQGAGVRIVAQAESPHEAIAAGPDTPVGESFFASGKPLTVRRASSVMVSMVQSPTDGEVVYLYDAESARGNSKYAFRAVRFRNPTDSTLETGPLTVYGEGRFIGEGLADPIPPKATAVVPFALDRQVVISREDDRRDQISSLVTLQRGILTANVQHIRATKLKVTNRLHEPAKLFMRHTVEKGWKLINAPEVYESIGDAHLFMIELKAGETKVVDIEEATPIVKTVDLRTDVGLNMVKIFVEAPHADPAFTEAMKKLLAIHKEIADHEQTMASVRQRLVDYRERMDELHAQLVTLEAVKSKGDLMTHLKTKMKEISERVQKETIDLVNLEEKAMLARIRFQDSVAELDFEKGIAVKVEK